jgi:hypothetical protein
MNDDDREELLYRRIAEKVAESADKQIKGRYFWTALLFAGLSWFGGVALITSIVQSRVAEKMEPAQMAVAQAKVLTEQLSTSLNDAQKNATKLIDSLKVTNQKLDDAVSNENRLEKQLAALQSAAELAASQVNEHLKVLNQAVTQSDIGQGSKAEAVAKLDTAHVVIRFASTDAPANLVAQLPAKIESSGKYSVTIESSHVFVGSSSLRYFYKGDGISAYEIARVTTEALRQLGVDGKTVPIVDLTGLPIKRIHPA